jgi:hypothetical protein
MGASCSTSAVAWAAVWADGGSGQPLDFRASIQAATATRHAERRERNRAMKALQAEHDALNAQRIVATVESMLQDNKIPFCVFVFICNRWAVGNVHNAKFWINETSMALATAALNKRDPRLLWKIRCEDSSVAVRVMPHPFECCWNASGCNGRDTVREG